MRYYAGKQSEVIVNSPCFYHVFLINFFLQLYATVYNQYNTAKHHTVFLQFYATVYNQHNTANKEKIDNQTTDNDNTQKYNQHLFNI
jgi:cbb3-type cytochrome oxidase subunit 3